MLWANQIAGFVNQIFIRSKLMKQPYFFACWYKLIRKLSKIFWLGMVKNGCGQSGHWTLKLTVSEEWTGINWFFACWYKSMQILIENWLDFSEGWRGQKWVWSVWWLDSKIDYLKKVTDFCMLMQIHKN